MIRPQAKLKGLLVDSLLMIPGYSREDFTRPPAVTGRDKRGLKVRWFYPGLVLEMRVFPWRKDPTGPQNAYRVRRARGAKIKKLVRAMETFPQ